MRSVAAALGVALVALLAYGLAGVEGDTTIDSAVRSGERPVAPSRTLPRVGGGEGSIAELRGRPVIVDFWASWCEPCEAEAPLLVAAHRRLRRAGGTVLGVTVQDIEQDSQQFARRHGLAFPSLRDVGGKLADEFGSIGVPETSVLDRAGHILMLQRGQVDQASIDRALDRVMR